MDEVSRGSLSNDFNPTLSRERFNDVAKDMTIRAVTLSACHCQLIDRQKATEKTEELVGNLNYSPRFQCFAVDESFTTAMTVDATMDFMNGETRALMLACSVQVDYISRKPIDVAFFDVFGRSSLVVHAIPFIREIFINMTARMAVPLAVVPLFPAPDVASLLVSESSVQ